MAGLEIINGKKLLAVDDEKDVLEVIQEQLETARLTTACWILTRQSSTWRRSVWISLSGHNGCKRF